MRLISSTGRHPLHSAQSTRLIEQALARTLPPHELMVRAGAAIARLTRAVAPHARSIWIACGPGNNGGDGLMAAAMLAPWARQADVALTVSWCGNQAHMPADARHALDLAQQACVQFAENPPEQCDVAIDALLGLGGRGKQPAAAAAQHPEDNRLQEWRLHLRTCADTLINVDLPTGLNADTGALTECPSDLSKNIAVKSINTSAKRQFTLTFLTLKPGLFTAAGKDEAGEVWFEDLGAFTLPPAEHPAPSGWLGMAPLAPQKLQHQAHKGSFGDVWIVGGQGIQPLGAGMTGAAVLAGRAALHAGAGRVLVVPLGEPLVGWDPVQPELMFRAPSALHGASAWPQGTWVCGCGGGDLIAAHLPPVLQNAQSLVLDADALNAVAQNPALAHMLTQRRSQNKTTVLTPHPLEAARLLGVSTAQIQADRMAAARQIATQFQALCVLKGSGTVVCPANGLACINTTGNARLATAGTGDVLAGMLGAALARAHAHLKECALGGHAAVHVQVHDANAREAVALEAVLHAVHKHGELADHWPPATQLTAGRLAAAVWQDNA